MMLRITLIGSAAAYLIFVCWLIAAPRESLPNGLVHMQAGARSFFGVGRDSCR